MYLLYADESGNTGIDFNNKDQPFFCLAGVCVEDSKWHEINNKFEEEKIKIYPEFKDHEIHATELFNAPKKSIFKKYSWQENLNALEKLIDLVISLDIDLRYIVIEKQGYKKHISNFFSSYIPIDPYVYAFGAMHTIFNDFVSSKNDYGIIFTDEINSVSGAIEAIYPKLNEENTNIIEKTFYLDSKKNNFIQIADICALYFNKYNCITKKDIKYNDLKQEHCIAMYNKLQKKSPVVFTDVLKSRPLTDIDNLFK